MSVVACALGSVQTSTPSAGQGSRLVQTKSFFQTKSFLMMASTGLISRAEVSYRADVCGSDAAQDPSVRGERERSRSVPAPMLDSR